MRVESPISFRGRGPRDRRRPRPVLRRVPSSANGRVIEDILSTDGRRFYREVDAALTVQIADLTVENARPTAELGARVNVVADRDGVTGSDTA